MMYQKALLFKDTTVASQILKADHPRKVKSLGRKVKNFTDEAWNSVREEIVRRGTYLKFTNAVTEEGFSLGTGKDEPPLRGSLREMLLATGDREIVEASPYDAIWGIGLAAKNAEGMRDEWGLNLLGKALMEVRTKLREEEEKKKKQTP